jgi:hypothetical protein
VSINGYGTFASVGPGSQVSLAYDYQLWNADFCPGCIAQLVSGLQNSHFGSCAYDGIPGVFPGQNGSENISFTAPDTPGQYDIFVHYFWQYGCSYALNDYPSSSASMIIGQIEVLP